MPRLANAKKTQTGGSRPFIRDLVPGVISTDTMDAQMDFLLVSGHGVTDTRQLMVVPENTFLMFVGESAFVRPINEAVGLLPLLNAHAYNPAWSEPAPNTENFRKKLAAAEVQRKEDMFKTFITGESNVFKFYKGAAIYCPGDVLPDTQVYFKSGLQYIWNKGIYSLPIRETELWNFTAWTNPVYELAQLVSKGELHMDFITTQLKLGKRAEFESFAAMPYTEFLKKYNRTGEDLMEEFFVAPHAFAPFFDNRLYSKPGNLALDAKIPVQGIYLSEIFTKIHSAKPYRFFIFTGCRGPILPEGSPQNLTYGFELRGALPANFPPQLSAAPLRKLQRRYSVSSKCVTERGAPAMNLVAIRNVYFQMIHTPNFAATIRQPGFESVSNIVTFLQMHFFSGAHMEYSQTIPAPILGILLAYAYTDIPVEAERALPAFKALVETIQDSFADFTRLLRREAPFNTKGKTIEEIVLEYSGLDPTTASTKGFPEMAAASIRGEERRYESLYKREVAAFHKEIDDVIQRNRAEIDAFESGVSDLVLRTKELMKNTPDEKFGQMLAFIEPIFATMFKFSKSIGDTFETEEAEVVYKYRFLKPKDVIYSLDETEKLKEKAGTLASKVKPLEDLLKKIVDKAAAVVAAAGPGPMSEGGGKRRGNQTRRLRVTRR